LKRFLSDWSLALIASAVIVVTLGWLSTRSSVPQEAPDFTVETTDEETLTLSELRGQVVVLNFWATWCGPCLNEIPHFSEFATKNPDVKIIGVAVKSKAADVAALDKKLDIAYPLVITKAKDAILDDYEMNKGNTVFPTTYVIDADGQIVGDPIKKSISYKELAEVVARASESD
jgi:thiol-disulfide isomerase/thioredoxin